MSEIISYARVALFDPLELIQFVQAMDAEFFRVRSETSGNPTSGQGA